jgi:hypothetical protein
VKAFSVSFVLLMACTNTSQKNNAVVSFTKAELDLGLLEYKHSKTVSFEIENPGETPLIIFDVKTSCGCTVPNWSKKPIKPGKTESIQVTYDADFPGRFKKTIAVFYNGANSPDTLVISGEVEYPDELVNAE